jgi:hypothetical protein
MTLARELSPKPSPAAIPTARAMTFLTVPPSSVPTTSVFVYGLKYSEWQAFWMRCATDSSTQATTVAAGWRNAISPARLGPDTTATRSALTPATSTMTSLIRLAVPSSIPFIRLTNTVPAGSDGTQAVRLSRSVCEGTANTTMSAPAAASAGWGVARTVGGSSISGR